MIIGVATLFCVPHSASQMQLDLYCLCLPLKLVLNQVISGKCYQTQQANKVRRLSHCPYSSGPALPCPEGVVDYSVDLCCLDWSGGVAASQSHKANLHTHTHT